MALVGWITEAICIVTKAMYCMKSDSSQCDKYDIYR